SIVGGKGWDEAVVTRLAAEMRAGVHITTNGLDSLAAFQAMGVTSPYLVLPPWFSDDTVALGLTYYRDHGVEPAGHMRYDPGRKWRELQPSDLYPLGMGFEQEIEPLYTQIRNGCPDNADGVFIAGTGFRCVGILDALERDLGRPVLSANQVSLWHCLRLSGVRAEIDGYGSLFDF
ncbi:MAG: hypothetical protein ACK5JT_16870, partial [Hyphomicrobiaceae bacterium]